MLNLTTVRISIKSNNSHVKVGNMEIANYQMKKCVHHPIDKVDGSTSTSTLMRNNPLFHILP